MGDEISAAMDRSVITARGLRKVYKNKAALAGTDFEIRAGRIVGLIGRASCRERVCSTV